MSLTLIKYLIEKGQILIRVYLKKGNWFLLGVYRNMNSTCIGLWFSLSGLKGIRSQFSYSRNWFCIGDSLLWTNIGNIVEERNYKKEEGVFI